MQEEISKLSVPFATLGNLEEPTKTIGKSTIWEVPGASWGRPGASWGRPGASWGRLGGVMGPLGTSWGPLGGSWGHLGAESSIFRFATRFSITWFSDMYRGTPPRRSLEASLDSMLGNFVSPVSPQSYIKD